jgi:hypothetical protein
LLFVSPAFAATTRYVDLNSTNASPPFTDWTTAATNIQDAIDVAVDGDLVLVTNGVYATGGKTIASVSNRVAITKAITVQSINGAAETSIQGNQPLGSNAARCVYLTNNATIIGFTLTNGSSFSSGAGAWCQSSNCFLINCVIVSNYSYGLAGGCYSGTLTGCIVANNIMRPLKNSFEQGVMKEV